MGGWQRQRRQAWNPGGALASVTGLAPVLAFWQQSTELLWGAMLTEAELWALAGTGFQWYGLTSPTGIRYNSLVPISSCTH